MAVVWREHGGREAGNAGQRAGWMAVVALQWAGMLVACFG